MQLAAAAWDSGDAPLFLLPFPHVLLVRALCFGCLLQSRPPLLLPLPLERILNIAHSSSLQGNMTSNVGKRGLEVMMRAHVAMKHPA
jgi:hypothetical protein